MVVEQKQLGKHLGQSVVLRDIQTPDPIDKISEAEIASAARTAERKENLARLLDEQRARRHRCARNAERRKRLEAEAQRQLEEEVEEKERIEFEMMQKLNAEEHATKEQRKKLRMQNLSKLQTLCSRVHKKVEKSRDTDGAAEEEEARNSMLAKRNLVIHEREEREARMAQEAFSRYDTDGSGTLELEELRAVLEDLGILPKTPLEKAAVRRSLRNVALGLEDGQSDDETGPELPRDRAPSSTVVPNDDAARDVTVTIHQLPGLLKRIRTRLKTCHQKADLFLFMRHDVWHTGELDLQAVVAVLGHLGLDARDEIDEATFEKVVIELECESKAEGHLDFPKFQTLVSCLREAREQRAAEDQWRLAEDMGVRDSKLFAEFRTELNEIQENFAHFDTDGSGALELNEAWIVLMSLGLMPKGFSPKRHIMRLITNALRESGIRLPPNFGAGVDKADDGRPQPGIGIGSKLLLMYHPNSDCVHSEVVNFRDRLDFEGFLRLLSQVREWTETRTREELRPIFQRMTRKQGECCSIIGVPQVCRSLGELDLGPKTVEEQAKIKVLLEDTNEWGFDTPTLDFDSFACFIRRVREWMRKAILQKEMAVAKGPELGFDEQRVNECRLAFDILDAQGTGELDFSGARKVFRVMGRKVTVDRLNELFARFDHNQSGTINFIEFLNLVNELDICRTSASAEEERKVHQQRWSLSVVR